MVILTKQYLASHTKEQLNLSNEGIEDIEIDAFENHSHLTKISLNQNQLKSIDGKKFNFLINLSKLLLKSNQIETIDGKAFENCSSLKELFLNDNKLTQIDSDTFKLASKLSILSLNDNLIKRIDPEAFVNCQDLSRLSVINNRLTQICAETFRKTVNLIKLSLNFNRIETIDKRLFENCLILEELYLKDNKLTSIDSELFENLSLLTSLWICHNEIKTIGENSFKNCSVLKELYLNNNKLTIIGCDLFENLFNLDKLYLNNNEISSIDEEAFVNCKKLTKLYLDNNKLTSLSGRTLEKLTKLSEFSLNNNLLKTIDVELFRTCSDLIELNISDNLLTRIDGETFSELVNLVKLSFNHNQINVIDSNAFENLVKLENLYLSDNKLQNLDGEVFKNLTELKILSIFNNQIEEIDVNAFKACTKLVEIKLTNNDLKMIDKETFESQISLVNLDLVDNKIESIEVKAFETCSHLRYLDLSNNKLTSLEGETLRQMKRLTHLSLRNNKIKSINLNLIENNLLQKLYLDNNKLKSINTHSFEHLTKLTTLSMSGNQIKNVETKSFENLSEIQNLDLSNNCIEENLELAFDCRQPKVNLNFSFNNIKNVSLEFRVKDLSSSMSKITTNQNVRINVSSNDIVSLDDVKIDSFNNSNMKFEINLRFNSLQSIWFNNYESQLNSTFDLAKNPLKRSCREEIAKNRKYQEKFRIVEKQAEKNRFKKGINFQVIEHYPHIVGLKSWDNISSFSVITGKNGVGKLTVLSYIKDYIKDFYNTMKENENLFIPVIYKMHEKIQMISIGGEFKEIENNFLKKLNETHKYDEMTWEVFERVRNIFTVNSIDKLILMFKNNIDRINQHLSDVFKYKIKINDSTTDSPSVSFIGRYNSKIKVKNSSDLSPGEQLMLLFRLWEFALTRYEIPHTPVLLLDEPDAHLHPQKVHEFVQILEKLSEAGAQIIMTTHNPTTVSLVKKENLYCMKSDFKGSLFIEKSKLKTDVIRELTNNLILVNEPYRVVLVEGAVHDTNLYEPEYKSNERDAIFYRFVNCILSEKSSENNDDSFSRTQLVFKSYSGHDNILGLLKSLDQGKMYQDHYAIIDNDNFFQICSNQENEIGPYYAKRTKRRFNLLRHSLENYILDPINLFVYLNFYRKQEKSGENPRIKVNGKNLDKLHKLVANEMNISFGEFKTINADLIDFSNFEQNKILFQAVVTSLGSFLIEYLTQIDDFDYRIFKRKNELNNMSALFQHINSIINQNNSDQSEFFSLKLLKDQNSVKNKFKIASEDLRYGILSKEGEEDEKLSKENDLKEFKDLLSKVLVKIRPQSRNLKIRNILSNELNFSKLTTTYQGIRDEVQKSKEFSDFRQSVVIINQEDVKKHLLDFIDKINSIENESSIKELIENVDTNELKSFIDLKFKLDKLLIDILIDYLLQPVKCCFFEHENHVFNYPFVFYKLRGHFLERIIYEMFFIESEENKKFTLVNDLLKDEGVMKNCGFMVPNELAEIFKRIQLNYCSRSSKRRSSV